MAFIGDDGLPLYAVAARLGSAKYGVSRQDIRYVNFGGYPKPDQLVPYIESQLDLRSGVTFVDTGFRGTTAKRIIKALETSGYPHQRMSIHLMDSWDAGIPDGGSISVNVVEQIENLNKPALATAFTADVPSGGGTRKIFRYCTSGKRSQIAGWTALQAIFHALYETKVLRISR